MNDDNTVQVMSMFWLQVGYVLTPLGYVLTTPGYILTPLAYFLVWVHFDCKPNQNMEITSVCMCALDTCQSSIKHDDAGVGNLTLSQISPSFYAFAVQVLWKHCGKRRNCLLRAISPFPTVFSTNLKNFLSFSSNLKLSSADSFSLEWSKICRLGKG